MRTRLGPAAGDSSEAEGTRESDLGGVDDEPTLLKLGCAPAEGVAYLLGHHRRIST
jgi:hypothetical protein